jgi:hypothetical protein
MGDWKEIQNGWSIPKTIETRHREHRWKTYGTA